MYVAHCKNWGQQLLMQLTPKTEQQLSRLEVITNSFLKVPKQTEFFVRSLSVEDQCVWGIAETSPTKWHLAHTTWFFFKTFIPKPYLSAYEDYNSNINFLLNSYYEQIGKRHASNHTILHLGQSPMRNLSTLLKMVGIKDLNFGLPMVGLAAVKWVGRLLFIGSQMMALGYCVL